MIDPVASLSAVDAPRSPLEALQEAESALFRTADLASINPRAFAARLADQTARVLRLRALVASREV